MVKLLRKTIAIGLMLSMFGCLCGCANTNVAQNIGDVAGDTYEENDSENDETNGDTTTDTTSLKDFFAEHDMKVGTCLSILMLGSDEMKDLIKSQYNSITMENAMKPDYIIDKRKSVEAGEIVVNFNSDMMKMLEFAKENNMAVRGHTLIWHNQTPDWIFHEDFNRSKELVSREEMLRRMESYISQVFNLLSEAGYIDLFYAYDVVNEAIMEDGSLRDSLWREVIGDDYIYQAFYFADKYAPESIDLYYNDYNEQYKADRIVKLVDELTDENCRRLVDGIGLQAHLYTMDNLPGYLTGVSKIADSGIKVEVTELDVGLGAYQKVIEDSDENLRAQGKYYYELIEGLLKMADEGKLNMDALTFWGVSDSMSWRSESSPLLFTGGLEPKYAYYGVIQDKERAWGQTPKPSHRDKNED